MAELLVLWTLCPRRLPPQRKSDEFEGVKGNLKSHEIGMRSTRGERNWFGGRGRVPRKIRPLLSTFLPSLRGVLLDPRIQCPENDV